jgi:hypothetical protein
VGHDAILPVPFEYALFALRFAAGASYTALRLHLTLQTMHGLRQSMPVKQRQQLITKFKESQRMENMFTANNPFALMTDPAAVHQVVEKSEQLSKLSQRQCHPLDRAVIRSASAELAAFDSKIDRTTIYLPPEEDKPQSITRTYTHTMN